MGEDILGEQGSSDVLGEVGSSPFSTGQIPIWDAASGEFVPAEGIWINSTGG